jgi:hypothetical protein
MSDLTQARLRELLEYDEVTGEFVWRVSRSTVKAGDVAGCLYSNGYHYIRADGRGYRRARLVLLYVDNILLREDEQVDHINRVRNDDRRCNLRASDQTGNMHNRGIQANNTSGAARGSLG